MSLSDKKVKINEGISDYSFTWYEEKDVKEFIKELKEKLNRYWEKEDDVYGFTIEELYNELDTLAGK